MIFGGVGCSICLRSLHPQVPRAAAAAAAGHKVATAVSAVPVCTAGAQQLYCRHCPVPFGVEAERQKELTGERKGSNCGTREQAKYNSDSGRRIERGGKIRN